MPSPVLVRDLMTVGVPTCAPGTAVEEIAQLLAKNGWEALIVLDPEERHALGVVSQSDLVRVYAQGNPTGLRAEDVMQSSIPKIPPDIPLHAAAQIMQDNGVRALFLMHHAGGIEYPAAWITYQHFIRHLAAIDAGELHDLGIYASRESPLQAFIQRRDQARRQRKD